MGNYIKLNGKSSDEIQGLLIQELPPISKPKIRTRVDEIDGRDGDIVTKLGYKAYDKTISVGLYGEFDINDIIEFFNSQGVVIFSNEPDKYYNYEILEQIDFERLIRFRKAKVKMHVQPFKYLVDEEEIDIGVTSGEGTEITLSPSSDNIITFGLKGNTYQLQTTGRNLLDIQSIVKGIIDYDTGTIIEADKITSLILDDDSFSFTSNATSYNRGVTSDYISVDASSDYVFKSDYSIPNYEDVSIWCFDSNKDLIDVPNVTKIDNYTNKFTTLADTSYVRIVFLRSGAGTTIIGHPQFQKGATPTEYERYSGGVATPTPSNPSDIHIVSGDNEIKVCGKNLCKIQSLNSWEISSGIPTNQLQGINVNSFDYNNVNITITVNAYRIALANIIQLEPNTTYTLKYTRTNTDSGTSPQYRRYVYEYVDGTYVRLNYLNSGDTGNQEVTFTTTNGTVALAWGFGNSSKDSVSKITNIQLEKGSSSTTYEPYTETDYEIDLPSGMELNKIGTYQDYFYKNIPDALDYSSDRELGVWYLKKNIGKYTFTGSETGYLISSNNNGYLFGITSPTFPLENYSTNYLNNYSLANSTSSSASSNVGSYIYSSTFRMRVPSTIATTFAQFKTWLGTANNIICYTLSTSTYTKITDTTLIGQLEALRVAHGCNGVTYISQVNNDMPIILSASVLSNSYINIVNQGNIYSKPTLTIYGQGEIAVNLNGNQVFQIDLGNEEYITIDAAQMEASKDGVLKNRLVTGNYDNFILNPGSNTLNVSGNVTEVIVTNYSRWL